MWCNLDPKEVDIESSYALENVDCAACLQKLIEEGKKAQARLGVVWGVPL